MDRVENNFDVHSDSNLRETLVFSLYDGVLFYQSKIVGGNKLPQKEDNNSAPISDFLGVIPVDDIKLSRVFVSFARV